jgi:hypothetical protein
MSQRQLSLLHGCGGELQRSQDVGPLQIRIVLEDLFVLRSAANCPSTAATVTRVSRMHGSPSSASR